MLLYDSEAGHPLSLLAKSKMDSRFRGNDGIVGKCAVDGLFTTCFTYKAK